MFKAITAVAIVLSTFGVAAATVDAGYESGHVVTIGEYQTGPFDVSNDDRLDVRFDMHRSGNHVVTACDQMGGTVAFRPLPYRFGFNAYFCMGVDF